MTAQAKNNGKIVHESFAEPNWIPYYYRQMKPHVGTKRNSRIILHVQKLKLQPIRDDKAQLQPHNSRIMDDEPHNQEM